MSGKILLIEDCMESRQLAQRALSGYQLDCARSLAEALQFINKSIYDVVLMDVMLPDGDGFKLCSLLRANDELKNTSIIFLTAKNALSDKIFGFQVGGEDFITKPYDPLELKARVDARVRKIVRQKQETDTIRLGDLEIDKRSQRAAISSNGVHQNLDLTPLEFKILVHLANKPNAVVTRDEILSAVWGENIYVYARNVDTHVSKLRKKMGSRANMISGVHGVGYRFVLDPEERVSELKVTFQDTSLAAGHKAM